VKAHWIIFTRDTKFPELGWFFDCGLKTRREALEYMREVKGAKHLKGRIEFRMRRICLPI